MISKGIRALALLAAAALLLTGCTPIVAELPEKTSVYTTFFPLYALASLVAEGVEDVEIHCLVQPQDDCLRSYELSDWDLYMLAYSADMIIAAGGGLEGFSDQLKEIGQETCPMAEVMHGLELYQTNGLSDEESHFSGANPHLYMSWDGAIQIAENISAAMSLVNPENAGQYEQNLIGIEEKFALLQKETQKQTELYTDIPAAVLHESLFYPAVDCGLDVRMWYERESGEMLYDKGLESCLNELRKSEVRLVLVEDYAPKALVEVIEREGYVVVPLNVMSTLSEKDGIYAYEEALKSNAQAVAEACKQLQ